MNKKKAIIIIIVFIILLIILLFNMTNSDVINIKLRSNDKEIFTVNDLVINNLKFGSTEKEIKKQFGKPKSVDIKRKKSFKYKIYNYKKLKLTLRENYSNYILVGVETTSVRYKISRNIRIGNKATKVLNSYNIKNKTGSYIYGNYKLNSLKNNDVTDNIYLGIRTNKQIMYVNRDKILDSPYVNTAQIIYNYNDGRITKIKWLYDFN